MHLSFVRFNTHPRQPVSAKKSVYKRYDDAYLIETRVVSVFYSHDYTLCDRLPALPSRYRLIDCCIVPVATEKGGAPVGLGATRLARGIREI
jgi:hypothetical protein